MISCLRVARTCTIALAALLVSCAPPVDEEGLEEPEEYLDAGKADSFDWGSGLAAGSGTLEVQATGKKTIVVGKIPAGKRDVRIALTSTVDFDIQLYDGSTRVVYRTYGLLKGAGPASTSYKGVEVSWSGYNGVDGKKGDELLELKGKTSSAFTFKLRTLKAGETTIAYSWAADQAPPPASGFAARLQAFAQKHPGHVTVASKQGRPAIFVKTSFSADESLVKTFFADLYAMLGGNTIMIWNPAGDNYFHLGLGIDDRKNLDATFRQKSIRLYSHFHVWDNSLGNLDESCGEGDYDDEENEYLDLVEDPCHDPDQIDRERAVALIELSDAQLKDLSTYLGAIRDDFEGTLGPADYYGGVPPYFGGEKHNCTSWFTVWLNQRVSSAFPTSANPASLLQSVTTGGYSGTLAKEVVGLLVFNHPNPPAAGAELPKSFPLDFGH
jgi:hypothetical protein